MFVPKDLLLLIVQLSWTVHARELLPRATATPAASKSTSIASKTTVTSTTPVAKKASPDFIGYTSAFSSYSSSVCDDGSTFKSFGATLGACCPIAGNCNPITSCFASKIAFFQDGSASTCKGPCSTGYLYKTVGGKADTMVLPGCHEVFTLYRDIPAEASASIDATATTIDSSTDSSSASSSSTTDSSSATSAPVTNGSSSKHTTTIVAVVVAILLLFVVAGLLAYIILMRKRDSKKALDQGQPPTELAKMQSPSTTNVTSDYPNDKAELPGMGATVTSWELPNTPAPQYVQLQYSQNGQVPAWSPHTPVAPYPGTPPVQYTQPAVQPYSALELPVNNRRSKYAELPG